MDGALRNRATAGDLMLAQSERMEPQNFLQLAHGQPLLWHRESLPQSWISGEKSTLRRAQLATAAPHARSNPMPITIPNDNRETDRLQFGMVIGILRNPHPSGGVAVCTPARQLIP